MSGVLVILGGTFDPVHIGHLRAAIELREALAAAEVRLLPCAVPPHRAVPGASAAQRLAMLQAALIDSPGIGVDARELDRPGPSYTVDTLTELRQEQGERPLVLAMGADAFAGLPSWHRWDELIELAHIAVLTRPDSHQRLDPRLETLLAQRGTADPLLLAARPAGALIRIEILPIPVSSTLIRQRLAAGRSLAHLVPAGVLALIDQYGLYRRDR
jgi:nicotinate-nucleotide adenylyltransferase